MLKVDSKIESVFYHHMNIKFETEHYGATMEIQSFSPSPVYVTILDNNEDTIRIRLDVLSVIMQECKKAAHDIGNMLLKFDPVLQKTVQNDAGQNDSDAGGAHGV